MKVDCPECGTEYESEGAATCSECGFGPDDCDHPVNQRYGKLAQIAQQDPDPTYIRCGKCGGRLDCSPEIQSN